MFLTTNNDTVGMYNVFIRFCCLLYNKDELHFSIKRAQTPVFLCFCYNII
jgi:hypothetical protein